MFFVRLLLIQRYHQNSRAVLAAAGMSGLNTHGIKICKIYQGLKLSSFSREPNCIFKSYLKALCIETSTFLGSLQKFEGCHRRIQGSPLILSPVYNAFSRIRHLMTQTPTAYSLVMMHKDRIYAVRDPFGNRPLCLGKLQSVIRTSGITSLFISGSAVHFCRAS